MKVKFNLKYGQNEIDVPISGTQSLKVKCTLKYGPNEIDIPISKTQSLKVRFDLKYGQNEIEVAIPDVVTTFRCKGLLDAIAEKVTIFHSVTTADEKGHKSRRFDKMVVEKCSVQGGFLNRPDGTIKNVVPGKTVIIRDVARYKTPLEYLALSADERSRHYTVHVGDFIVFAEVDDVVNNSREFSDLQERYKDSGMVIAAVTPSIFGLDIDNITITSA